MIQICHLGRNQQESFKTQYCITSGGVFTVVVHVRKSSFKNIPVDVWFLISFLGVLYEKKEAASDIYSHSIP